MTEYELNRLAELIVEKQASSPQWMEAFAMARVQAEFTLRTSQKRLISAKQGADRLGISVGHLYHIKEHFTYVKGESKSSPLKFNEDTLQDEYKNYLEKEGRNANPFLEPIRKAL